MVMDVKNKPIGYDYGIAKVDTGAGGNKGGRQDPEGEVKAKNTAPIIDSKLISTGAPKGFNNVIAREPIQSENVDPLAKILDGIDVDLDEVNDEMNLSADEGAIIGLLESPISNATEILNLIEKN